MIDELETINKYESMADNADDPKVAEVIRDVADEEKVHTGEGAAIVAANDPRAKPAMEEGVKEATKMAGFKDMYDEAMAEKYTYSQRFKSS
jgi:rubrerythrin